MARSDGALMMRYLNFTAALAALFIFLTASATADSHYPADAKRCGEEGVVIVAYIITDAGSVRDPAIVQSSGFDTLDDAARTAVLAWRYKPARDAAGKAIEAPMKARLVFRLDPDTLEEARERNDPNCPAKKTDGVSPPADASSPGDSAGVGKPD